ncbi:hypothetical protein GRX03_10195 [Halovenus sp. WSH3]|uniref:CARDB domain-containing protein n=1 Tax=Halovenus carboxidivorans TaxID=2692199 RepID=A0A6B0T188_9EURY|nr:hypothetical protein [Halovenus carboxidivorans]MXR51968.1 hypothetical protein [Halovenus carboxidivorans]
MPSGFRSDERAVEGMPIRLLVAVTVGVAAFGLLVPMADQVEQADRTELTVEPEPRQVTVEPGDTATVRLDVATSDGQPVRAATLVVTGRSVSVENGPLIFETGANSTVSFDIGASPTADVRLSFRPQQSHGTVQLRIVPPSNSEYVDDLSNPDLTVRRTG